MERKMQDEIRRMQKIAGIKTEIELGLKPDQLEEDDYSDPSDAQSGDTDAMNIAEDSNFNFNPNWEEEEVGPDDEGAYGSEIVSLYKLPSDLGNGLWDFYLSIEKTPEGKYYVHFFEDDVKKDMQTQYDTLSQAQQAAADLMDDIVDSSNDDTDRPEYD